MKKTFTLWAACALPMLSPLSAQEGADEHAKTLQDRERLIDLVINLEADFSKTLQDYRSLQKDYATLLKKPATPDHSDKVKELQTKLKQALSKLDEQKPSEEDARARALLEQDLVNLRNELHRERQDLLVARARLLRVKQLEEQNQSLQGDLKTSQADRTKALAEIKTLKGQLTETMQKLAQSEKKHQEAIARIGQLEKEATVLKQKVSVQDGELTKLRAEQEQYQKAMAAATDFKKEQVKLTALLAEREKQLANLQSHLADEVKRSLEIPLLIKARDELQKKLDQSTANSEGLKKKNETLTATKALLENEIETVRKSIAAMREQFEKNKETMDSVAKLSRENEILKSERGDLEETIAMAKQELVKAMGVRNRLEAELAEEQQESAQTIARNETLEDAQKGLLQEQNLLSKRLLETENSVANLEKDKATLAEQLNTRNAELKTLAESLTKNPGIAAEVAKLRKEKDDLAAKLAQREEDLKKTRTELGRLQISSTVSKNQLVALKRETASIAPVLYAMGAADVPAQQARVFEQIQNVLTHFPAARFEIVGHTCDIGSADGNLKLSRERAKSLHDFLVSKGVKADRLKYRGVGQAEPMVPNTSEANRRQNRRVVVEILD